MKKRHILPVYLILGFLFIRSNCDIISFDQQPLVVTVVFESTHRALSPSTFFSSVEPANFADLYSQAGINMDQISEVTIELIEVVITNNNTGPNTTASANLAYRESGPLTTEYNLASFQDVNLNSVLNQPITPFTAIGLGVNETGINQLKSTLSEVPPPNIVYIDSGSVNEGVVDFTATVKVKVQVKYTP